MLCKNGSISIGLCVSDRIGMAIQRCLDMRLFESCLILLSCQYIFAQRETSPFLTSILCQASRHDFFSFYDYECRGRLCYEHG